MRRRVFAEEKGCALCHVPLEGTQGQADHVVPRAQGGTEDRSNYQRVCDLCHRRKSSGEGGHARAGRVA